MNLFLLQNECVQICALVPHPLLLVAIVGPWSRGGLGAGFLDSVLAGWLNERSGCLLPQLSLDAADSLSHLPDVEELWVPFTGNLNAKHAQQLVLQLPKLRTAVFLPCGCPSGARAIRGLLAPTHSPRKTISTDPMLWNSHEFLAPKKLTTANDVFPPPQHTYTHLPFLLLVYLCSGGSNRGNCTCCTKVSHLW